MTDELTGLAGVTSVEIDLVPEGESGVRVASAAPLSVAEVGAALDEAGQYRLAAG